MRDGHKSDYARMLIKEYEFLDQLSGHWNKTYEQVAARIWPEYAGFAQLQGTVRTPGVQKTTEMIDATGAIALQRFSAVVNSLLTPESQKWHLLSPSDKTLKRHRSVREYFEAWTEILFDYRYQAISNFTGQKAIGYMALGAFGTDVMYTDRLDHFGQRGLRYKSVPVFHTVMKDNHQGVVDTVYRKFFYTARQAVQKFGEAALPKKILEDAKDKKRSEKEHWFIHCVGPREDYEQGRLDQKGMRYAETYVTVTEPSVVQEAGYNVFPYSVGRYIQAPGESRGRSPAMLALPSLKTLNEEKKTILKQGHKAVDPVMLIADDGVMDTVSIRPGAFISGGMSPDGRPLVGTLPVGNVALGHEMMTMEKEIINDAFLVSLFQILVETPQMTATEVVERTREKGILLAPTIGQQNAALGQLIEREIDTLAQQGIGPEMPAILREAAGEYTIVFDSPLTRMAKAGEASGFMQTVDWATEKAAAIGRPEILDPVNWEVAIPELLENRNVPLRWINSQDKIAALAQGRAQAAQQQQMIEAAPAASAMVKSAMAAKPA